ncbi:winged helix-turn-helix domain-containing protein [Kribbella italica]|uniref:DNA-binding GntR family transcriptional regulator n=1 Tax=Kribbella italica TaxID=1540520 RepID=A0A7W9JDI0_9ACTN|nr:winged helix-turn-helix domain-containing protein [Kribbella italica]MBB5839994.1 DNA-binding GntR family transcriptional regulator [Kribbella italica]
MTAETSAKYDRVASALRAEIRDGKHSVGAPLPPIAELTERFGISHMTAKQALKVLRDEGLIATGRGAPAKVVSPKGQPSVQDQLNDLADRLAAVERRTASLESHVSKTTGVGRESP